MRDDDDRDDEDTGNEENRELFEMLEERFGAGGSATQTRKLTEGQKKVLRRARRIHKSLVRPPGDGPAPGSFPSAENVRLDDIGPRVVRRRNTVTIIGKNLYGVGRVRVGGAIAPIVRRGRRDDEGLDTLEVFIPESAQDGTVRVNGERVEHLDIELIDDDDWSAS
jgi:hypothetical protein